MSESASVFNHPRTAASSTENVHGVVEQPPPTLAEGGRRKQQSQQQQQRQLLSCTKCRERKVKCDRTKPCSACCARGAPKECKFISEGGDYAPIQQSYELRKLRAENLRLKERLRASKIPIEDDDAEFTASPDSQFGDRPASSSHKRRTAKQKRFQGSKWSDSIYFGSPGLANVINDFAHVNLTPLSTQSLTHLMPRGADMYTPRNPPAYPFATLFNAKPDECIPELLGILPPRNELFGYLESFQKRVHVCSFPHVPMEITKSEVERFLSDAMQNAKMCPDMLALLFAALALGSQHCVWDKCGGQWVAAVMEEELQKGNVYIAAAMQALRMASFMHRPTLLGIQALIMIGPYLTNSGRFLDAWTLFGTTIRLAQSIGLHRHPKYLDPAPPTQRECSIRQTLWWWMLQMDQQYSMTLGRPLGISGIGDCPPPHELTTNPTVLRFGEFGHHFTVLARQILSSDRLNNAKIDEFTDALRGLLDTMPESLQFDETWLDEDKEIPEWPLAVMAAVSHCQIHNYLILLNRQRIEKQDQHSHTRPAPSWIAKHSLPCWNPVNSPPSSLPSPTPSTKATLRGRPLVLSSSEDLLTAFLFFYARVPAALICWTTGQQAFNSCMILLLDAIESGDLTRVWKVEKAFAVFTELGKHKVHKLANLAVQRVSWGLSELKRMRDDMDANVRGPCMVSEREGHHGGDVEMQGAGGSEAMQGSGGVPDTVMGNTGMLLLEDPGLQSFAPEAFSPFAWVMTGGEGEEAKPMQEQEQRGQGEQAQSSETEPDNMADPHTARSSEELHGAQGSALGSAPTLTRYATFCTAPSQEPSQPQGLTSPASASASTSASAPCSALLMPQEDMSGGIHRLPPSHAHLQRHSYPSLRQHVPTPPVAHPPVPPYAGAQRKHSYPHPTPRSQPPVSTYFSTSSGLAPVPEAMHHHTGHPGLQSSWTARSAAPALMSSVMEPALSFSHVSACAQGIPGLAQQAVQQDAGAAYQYAFPFRVSSAANDARPSVAAVAWTDAEQMGIKGWRRWAGKSGAG